MTCFSRLNSYISSLFTSLSGLFTGIFQGVGREKEATIMSVARGMILILIMITGNVLWGLQGVIWSLTASEILACLIGLKLWINFKQHPSMKIHKSYSTNPMQVDLQIK